MLKGKTTSRLYIFVISNSCWTAGDRSPQRVQGDGSPQRVQGDRSPQRVQSQAAVGIRELDTQPKCTVFLIKCSSSSPTP